LDALSHSERRSLEWRWDVLQKALTSRVNLYNPKVRAGLARRFVEQKIATRAALYEILRLYWRHAAGKQSLLPRFSSCGAPGKERLAVSEDRKVGRRRTTQPGRGLAMTAEHRQKMSIALAKTPVGKDG